MEIPFQKLINRLNARLANETLQREMLELQIEELRIKFPAIAHELDGTTPTDQE